MINELMMLQMAGGLGSGFDSVGIIAFIAIAFFYFIAPVVGYDPSQRAGLVWALYLLIGYAGISLLNMMWQWSQIVLNNDIGFVGRGFGRDTPEIFLLTFAIMKAVTFLGALIAFVYGLRSLRRRHGP